jgi:betaine-aldehyde dehydrogenase
VQTFEVFDDEEDAIRRANATQYGLATSIFTSDASQARRVGGKIRSGAMQVNTWGALSEEFEETSMKASGYGPLCGLRAIEEFQELKVYAEVDPTVAVG